MDVCRQTLSSLLQFVVLSLLVASSTSNRMTVSPTHLNVLLGDRAKFLCSYTPDNNRHCDDTFVFWGKKGGSTIANMTYVVDSSKYGIIWRPTVDEENDEQSCLYTLIIKDVASSDSGQYSCALIRPQSGRFYIARTLARLQVVVPPPPAYPLCRTSVIAGQPLAHGMALVCESLSGQPPASLRWVNGEYRLPAELHKHDNNRLLRLETTMTLADVDRLTDPVITCEMELPEPIAEIRSCSINTSTAVSVRAVRVDDPAARITTFTCHVTTSIPYTIDWLLNDQPIEPEDPHDRFFVETKAQALHIRDVTTEDDRGTVSCLVATMFGNFTGTAVLDDANKESITLEGGDMLLILGSIFGVFVLLVLLNVFIWCQCKRRFASGRSLKPSSPLAEENTPLSAVSNSRPAKEHGRTEMVTETETRSESQYLDMSKPVKNAAAGQTPRYSPMKGASEAADDGAYVMPTNEVADVDNQYVLATKSDDADTYVYSSADDLDKTNGRSTPKPVVKSKPSRPAETTLAPTEAKPGSENNTKAGRKVLGRPKKTTASDADDANDYEVLAKDVTQTPIRPKLNKMISEVKFQASPPNSAASSPKLTRNFSAPLLTNEPPEYAVPNDAYENTGRGDRAPVYDIPVEKSRSKSPNVGNFDRATERSPSPLLKPAARRLVAHKKPQRHSDQPSTSGSSSDSEPSAKRMPGRVSLPQAVSLDQYLVPNASQQNPGQAKPPTPTPVEGNKSPRPKIAKKALKPKNNNTETYQCLDRQSMELEKSDYQVLLRKRTVDECQLYENVATGAAM